MRYDSDALETLFHKGLKHCLWITQLGSYHWWKSEVNFATLQLHLQKLTNVV